MHEPTARQLWSAVLCAVVIAASCERRVEPAAHGEPATDRSVALLDDARLVLERNCGSCHIADYPTALPRALAVFDLRQQEWAARMSESKLRQLVPRLEGPVPPDGAPSSATDSERASVQRFVDAELERRGPWPR